MPVLLPGFYPLGALTGIYLLSETSSQLASFEVKGVFSR